MYCHAAGVRCGEACEVAGVGRQPVGMEEVVRVDGRRGCYGAARHLSVTPADPLASACGVDFTCTPSRVCMRARRRLRRQPSACLVTHYFVLATH